MIVETILWTGLVAAPIVRTTDGGKWDEGDPVGFTSTINFNVSRSEPSLDDAIAKDFSTISSVGAVLTTWEEGVLKVLVALDDLTKANRYKVYDKQMAAMEAFPDVGFDFTVIPRSGRSVAELCSEQHAHTYQRH